LILPHGRIRTDVLEWDVLLSTRPYRKAWTKEQALQNLKDQNGKQSDPGIVERFIGLKP
jgi:response regulator RpfG family c-di-GMP phosphodiesterase